MASAGGEAYHVEKVAEINDQFHIGVAGRSRYGNLLKFIDVPPLHPAEYKTSDYDPFEYLITNVVPAWATGLEKQFGKIPDQKEDWPWGAALVVIQGRIFQIHPDFTVTESAKEWCGEGSGSRYAIGAMAAGKSVEKALEIAAEHDLYTGGVLNVKKGIR